MNYAPLKEGDIVRPDDQFQWKQPEPGYASKHHDLNPWMMADRFAGGEYVGTVVSKAMADSGKWRRVCDT